MEYRRYGKTQLAMPVLTCGGMRYQASWNAQETDAINEENQANLKACLQRALDLGICHIETARGYGTSEQQIGQAMRDLPRDEIVLQTKIGPADSGDEFERQFGESLERLQTDHVEMLSIHGINNDECLEKAIAPGGPMDVIDRLRKEGKVGTVGFSTHGPAEVIIRAIRTGRFEYVNLHWFWIQQEKWSAVIEARARDMGVFIISPNDKGGKLYDPPERLVELCKPVSPIVFNDLFCLLHGEVHTLSIGVARPEDFDEHMLAVERLGRRETPGLVRDIEQRLNARCAEVLGEEYWATWAEGLPTWEQTPGEVNIPVILMLHNLAKAMDMVEYGKMRYGLLGNGGHWFPGQKVSNVEDVQSLEPALRNSPHTQRIISALAEAEDMFGGEERERLQED